MWRVLLCLICSLVLFGCYSQDSFTDEVRLGRVGDIDGFNPFFSRQPWFQGVYTTGEGLYRYDINSRKLALFHAKSVKWQKNQFLIELQDILWSNGSSLTAADYVTGCRWLTDAKLNAPNGIALRQAGVRCSSRGTKLIVTMPKKNTEVLLDLRPVPSPVFADFNAAQVKSAWMTAKEVITTAAFIPTDWGKNKQVIFTKNPYYLAADESGQPLPRASRVVVDIYPNHQTLVQAFKQGMVDLLTGIQVSDVADNPYVQVLRSENSFQMTQLTYSFDRVAGIGDKNVRQALAAAIDRQRLAAKSGDFAVSVPLFPGAGGVTLKPHLANRQLLKRLGKTYTLSYPQGDTRLQVLATALAKQLKVQGIRFILKPISLEAVKKRDFEFFIYDSLLYGLELFGKEMRCGKPAWLIHSGGCRFDWEKKLMGLLEQRPQPVEAITRVLHENLPSIPLVSQHYVAAWQPWLTGLLSSKSQNGLVGSADLVFLQRVKTMTEVNK